MYEKVLVMETAVLQPFLNDKNGCLFTEHNEAVFSRIFEDHSFMPRDLAEHDYNYKQIIPYVIIKDRSNYLLLQRTSKQTEKRLHNKYSLGIGGHINPDSAGNDENIITHGLYRELNEEVLLNDPDELKFIGIINDDSNSVSRVHLGFLHELTVGSPGYRILEAEKMTAQWVPVEGLREYYDGLETWSQIVYDYYINKNR